MDLFINSLFNRDGFEYQFGTNHLGHFALTMGLLPALKAAYKATGRNSRIVNLSSIAHAMSDIDFNDINFKNRDYEEFVSYGQSKTCNILFSIGLTKRYASEGVYSNAVMPGAIQTNLQRHMDREDWIKRGWMDENGKMSFEFKSIEAGASTSVWAAVAREFDAVGGLYLENCRISEPRNSVQEIFAGGFFGYMQYAMSQENADKLWDISEEYLKKGSP